MPGLQGSKDRLILLSGVDVADDLKLETVPTDHPKNAKALKNYVNLFCLCYINETTKPVCCIYLQNSLLNILNPLLRPTPWGKKNQNITDHWHLVAQEF